MTEYLIGIDGGGTKTDGLCSDTSGNVLTRSTTGPTSLTATSLGMASMNLVETFRQLTSELVGELYFPKVVIGVAGIDTPAEKQHAEDVFKSVLTNYRIGQLHIVNDIELVLAVGTIQENSVALISGTGSQCLGKRTDGQTARTSGMDFLLADQGSGYEVGRKVLRVATASYDGRMAHSVLEEMTLKHFEVDNFNDLKARVYFPILNKAQIAELAKICVDAYRQGDASAKQIMDEVVDDLEKMAETVVRRLDLENEGFELLCSGSLIKLDFIFAAVKARLEKRFAKMKIMALENEPAFGAIQIAVKEFRGGA
jgi:N-acetylglucosamine kinase-like BadF-type ATPase